MKLSLIILFFLIYQIAVSQKEYRKFRQTLPGLSCTDSSQYDHALHNIPLLEKWVSQQPRHYGAYYDLAVEYCSMCFGDTLPISEWSQKSIAANNKFIEVAPQKMKYRGYWNNAVLKGWLKDCNGAIEDLNMAKIFFRYRLLF